MSAAKLNLHTLLTELLPAQSKWRDIGQLLGVKPYKVNSIKGWESDQNALRQVLTWALEQRKITWEDVIKALEDPTVEEHVLAEEIAEKYGVRNRKRTTGLAEDNAQQQRAKEPKLTEDTDSSRGVLPGIKQDDWEEVEIDSTFDLSDYDNDRDKRLAFIINIVNYSDPKYPNRQGSDKDREKLSEVLENTLNCETGYKDDVRGGDISKEITQYVTQYVENNGPCDSFICCILAHGNQNVVVGADGVAVSIKKIAQDLNKRDLELANKPKIFFFQACQGTKLPTPMQLDGDVSNEKFVADMPIPTFSQDSDFFYGCASAFESAALRNPQKGSVYIQALCNALKTLHQKEDLVTMVTRVHKKVAGRKYNVDGVTYIQQPQLVSTLQKKFYFK